MSALQNEPKGARWASFGFALTVFGLLPSEIGYQDIAALIARQPGVTQRWQKHALGSPFGPVHAATFSFPRPTRLVDPARTRRAAREPAWRRRRRHGFHCAQSARPGDSSAAAARVPDRRSHRQGRQAVVKGRSPFDQAAGSRDHCRSASRAAGGRGRTQPGSACERARRKSEYQARDCRRRSSARSGARGCAEVGAAAAVSRLAGRDRKGAGRHG